MIAAQGAIGLEIIDDLKKMETVLNTAFGRRTGCRHRRSGESKAPSTRIIGISMKRGVAMAVCLKAGRPVSIEEADTLADSLGGVSALTKSAEDQ